MKRMKVVNGFKIGEEVESNDWQRNRITIVGFSGDGKKVHCRYPANAHALVWLPIEDIAKKSDEPKWYQKIGIPLGPTPP